MTEPQQPWPVRVKVLIGMGMAVLGACLTVGGLIVRSTVYMTHRDDSALLVAGDINALQKSVDGLKTDLGKNHDVAVQDNDKRDAQLGHMQDKIEKIETDIGRVEGQIGFSLKNPPTN